MCANDHDPEPELADLEKIKSNLWTVTDNTQKISDLCEKFQGLFTSEEKDYLNDLRDDHLKSFCFYARFLREQNRDNQSLLLKALRSTGNSQVADQIKTTSQNTALVKTRRPGSIAGLKEPVEEGQLPNVGRRVRNECEIKGKNRMYTTPESLHISKNFQHKLTSIILSDLQISLPLIQNILRPCVSLEDLELQNVVFSCPFSSDETEASLTLPQLKSYTFVCDKECSVNYSWETLFFFSLFGGRRANLLNLWRNRMRINVKSQSMEISMKESAINFKLPKKEFYDSPQFRSYVQTESVLSFLRELVNVDSLVCLLPKSFESVKVKDLPTTELRQVHLSGLKIEYGSDEKEECCRSYKNILLEDCDLTRDFLDDVPLIFPKAKSVLLRDCRVEGDEGADVSLVLT